MRAPLLFLLCLSVSSLSWVALAEVAKKEKTVDSSTTAAGDIEEKTDDDEDYTDGVIEENPDFVSPEGDEDDEDSLKDVLSQFDDDSESDDESDGSDDDDEGDDPKKKVSKKKKRSPTKFLKKNKMKIIIYLAIYAFRKEILRLFVWLLLNGFSEGGITNILKLVLFADFMRGRTSGEGESGPGLFKTPKLLKGVFDDSNPAYVPPVHQHFCFESLNEFYVKDGMALQKAMRNRHKGLSWTSSSTESSKPILASSFASFLSKDKNNKDKSKKDENNKDESTPTNTASRTVVVLDWTNLDEGISTMTQKRQEVFFLLSFYRRLVMEIEEAAATKTPMTIDSNNPPPLEVVVLLESPGGSVPDYGLAGQHLLRLRNEPGITLTICVDKVAASGGYMLCCTASPGKLYAAPFAYLGSIGVIAQQINVRRLLMTYGIEPIEYRGGRYKAPIGALGEISKDGKRVTQSQVNDIHEAFKQHVVKSRPILKEKIEEIGNGSVWLGTDALDLGLVDELKTSDEYIEDMVRKGVRVFKMLQAPKTTGFLFGPRAGHYGMMDAKQESTTSINETPTAQEVVEDLLQRSKTAMLRLPAQAKSLFSKSLKSFQF